MRLARALRGVGYALLGWMIVFSNNEDWDHFLSFFEVERRSWLIDHAPPLWSYQLCAGATRWGDPQAYGLSPLFAVILVFGSFWGAKLLMFGCTLLGAWYFERWLALLDPVSDEHSREVHRSVVFFVMLSNYMLWHYSVGHVPFSLMPFAFVPLYYATKGSLQRLTVRDALALFASAVAYGTAGHYHATIFMLLPLAAIGAVGGLVLLAQPARRARLGRDAIGNVRRVVAVMTLALAAASYKWVEVLRYQATRPRHFNKPRPEFNTLHDTLVYLLSPTWNDLFLGHFDQHSSWFMHEVSAFSMIPFLIIAVWVVRYLRPSGEGGQVRAWGPFLLAAAGFILVLCMADASPVPLFRWINQAVFKGAVRVTTRFEIGLLVLGAVYLVRLLAATPSARLVFIRWFSPIGTALTCLSVLTFLHTGQWARLRQILSYPTIVPDRMAAAVMAPPASFSTFMYQWVLAGAVVPNCYQPLTFERRLFAPEVASDLRRRTQDGPIDLVLGAAAAPPAACAESVSFSQNDLVFDGHACPPGTCLVVNGLNPYRTRPNLTLDPVRKLYCLPPNGGRP